MPSKARLALSANLKDIQTLMKLHSMQGGSKPGRRHGLEVLHKSAIVLLTAFWEAYCEDIAAEGLAHLVQHATSPDKLPLQLRKQIAKEIKEEPNEISPWQLAGTEWKNYVTKRLEDLRKRRNWDLMTPNSANIDKLFETALGIPKISDSWKFTPLSAVKTRKKLDDLVALRGNIAHRGKNSKTVTKAQAKMYRRLITRLAAKTGGVINRNANTVTGTYMW